MKNGMKRSEDAPNMGKHSDRKRGMSDIGVKCIVVGASKSIWGTLGSWNVQRTYDPWLTDMNHAAILHSTII